MEKFDNARDDLLLAASQARVLADLLLPYTDLKDVDRAALGRVLEDLASRLERDLDGLEAFVRRVLSAKDEEGGA